MDRRYMLIFTDGYKIKTNIYPTLEEARTAMKIAYDDYAVSSEPDLAEMSFLADSEAILYTDYDVFVWKIVANY